MPTPHSITRHFAVSICRDGQEAQEQGFVYRQPEYTGLRIERAVVVEKGTLNGNLTVDLILVDEAGNKYMTMVTGNLLKMLPI